MSFQVEPFTDSEKSRTSYDEIWRKNLPAGIANDRWTVDRGRNAFLLWGGADREPPYLASFLFCVKGRLFNPVFQQDAEKLPNGGYSWVYELKQWRTCAQPVPPTDDEFNEAKALLPDAIRAYVAGMMPGQSHTVTIVL